MASLAMSWREHDVVVAGRTVRLRLPLAPDDLLVDVATRDEPSESDPYWGYLWPAASVLSDLILRASWPVGTRALELGCGSGLVGIAGLMAGLDVVFSDLVSEAVELSLQNALSNGFPDAKGLTIDWRHPLQGDYDVLFASDVLYHSELHRPLIETIGRLLKPGGVCWIADPGRVVAREFLSQLSDAGFRYELRNAEGDEVLMPVPGHFCVIVIRLPQARI